MLNVNQFTGRCPWDISPDGGLLAVTLSQGKRRVPYDANYAGGNGAYIVLIDVETGESIEPFSDLQMSWAGRWSPDGQTLAAYVVAQDDHACVGLWNRHTREVLVVSNAMIPWFLTLTFLTPLIHKTELTWMDRMDRIKTKLAEECSKFPVLSDESVHPETPTLRRPTRFPTLQGFRYILR